MDEEVFEFEHPKHRAWLLWGVWALFIPVLAVIGLLVSLSWPYLGEAPVTLDCRRDVDTCEALLPDWFHDLPSEDAFVERVFARRSQIFDSNQAPTPHELRFFFEMGNTKGDSDWWSENLEQVAGWPTDKETVLEADRRSWRTEKADYMVAKRRYRRNRLLEIQIESIKARRDWDAHHREAGWILTATGLAGLALTGGVLFLFRLVRRRHRLTEPFRAVLGRHRYRIRDRDGLYEALSEAQISFLVYGATSDGHVGDSQGFELALRKRVEVALEGVLEPAERSRLESLTGQRES